MRGARHDELRIDYRRETVPAVPAIDRGEVCSKPRLSATSQSVRPAAPAFARNDMNLFFPQEAESSLVSFKRK